jgi:hypothetical protein
MRTVGVANGEFRHWGAVHDPGIYLNFGDPKIPLEMKVMHANPANYPHCPFDPRSPAAIVPPAPVRTPAALAVPLSPVRSTPVLVKSAVVC